MFGKLITGALLGAITANFAFAAPPIRLASPISVHPEPAPRDADESATRLQINDVGIDMFKHDAPVDLSQEGIFVLMDGFPLDAQREVTLELTTVNSLTKEAQLIGSSYDRLGRIVNSELPWTKVVMFKGTVLGDPDSRVFLGIGGGLVNGWVDVDGTRFMIGTRPSDGLTLIYDMQNIPGNFIDLSGISSCETDSSKAIHLPAGGNRDGVDGYAPCNQLWMAYETDNEFLDLFAEAPAGAVPAATAYVQMLIGAVSSILYEPILDIELVINYLRFWVDEDGFPVVDPWIGATTDAGLAEFRLYWDLYMTDIERGLAQLFSGRGLGGGLAGLNNICSGSGNAIMAMNGSFPQPLQSNSAGNWDFIVVAHETGHNFGMIHTFDMDEPPDECGEECTDYDPIGDPEFDCADYISTIMSYCHLCPGTDAACWDNGSCFTCDPYLWDANITFEFAFENIARAYSHLDNLSCDLWHEDPGPPTVIDDFAETEMNTPVDIEVLANDSSNDCTSELTIIRFDLTSTSRGIVSQSSPSTFLYTPPANVTGTDSFTYTIVSERVEQATTGNVVINLTRDPGPGSGPADVDDVVFIITVWGTARADWNGDGTTDIDDLLAALEGKFKPDLTGSK
ncbi:MAG: M12 family metallo-peptidase [Phycisphaerales bacterium]|nr:M12 family metallo-peptidase [Phycisphaerales bacterium]